MLLHNRARPVRTKFLWHVLGIGLLLGLNSRPSFAFQAKVIDCGKFADFPTLNSRSVDSHVLKKVAVSSPLLRTAAVHAVITVRVFVNQKGDVVCSRALGSGNALLKSLAEQAAMKWKFTPYSQRGNKNPFQGNISLRITQ